MKRRSVPVTPSNVVAIRKTIAAENAAKEMQRRREQKYNVASFQCDAHPFSRLVFEPGQLVPAQMFCPICGRILNPKILEPE